MNNKNLIHDTLDAISRKAIPEDTNILPEVRKAVKASQGNTRILPLRKLSSAVIIAIVVVLLMATAVYAAYRLFWDPGLQAVKDAGLGSSVNPTAQSTLLPEITPQFNSEKIPAMMVGTAETHQGVTVTLDWVSLNSTRLIFGFTASNLAEGSSFDNPLVAFNGTTPVQLTGSTMILSGTAPMIGEYVSYQVVNDVPEGSTVGMLIDLPLVSGQGVEKQVLATFHYELAGVPADSNEPTSGQQVYATKVNGLEVTLGWLQLTDKSTRAELCYDPPTTDSDWQLSLVTVQYADANYNLRGDSVLAETMTKIGDKVDQRCVLVTFPLGTGGDSRMLKLSIAEISNRTQRFKGAWNFNVMFPESLNVHAAQVTPTPTAMEIKSIGDLTATLQWAYADTHRIALLIHFDGWGEGYGIADVKATDDTGTEINTGMGWGSPEGDPSSYLVTLYFDEAALANKSDLAFHLDVPVYSPQVQGKPLASFRFDLDLPVYQAREIAPDQAVTVNGLEMKVVKVSITPSYTDITICFQKPSHGDWSDWMIGSESTLKIGESISKLDTYRLLSDSDYGGYTGKGAPPADLPLMDNGRCIIAGFPIGDLAKPGPTTITLTVPGLEKSMPEVIPDDQLKLALEKLNAVGIDVSVYSSSGNGGGGGGWTVNSKPEGMTDEEAYQKFKEALGYVYQGPWVMEIVVP